MFLNLGLLDNLKNLLESDDETLLKEATYIISNITAGTVSQINKVCKSNILYKIMDIIKARIGGSLNTFYEEYIILNSFFCILNAISGGMLEVKTHLMNYKINILDLLMVGLIYYDKKPNSYNVIKDILTTMKQFIWYEEEMLVGNSISEKFKKSQELIEVIENLSLSENQTITNCAIELLDTIDKTNLNEVYNALQDNNDVDMEYNEIAD